jgi:hypothetical protein
MVIWAKLTQGNGRGTCFWITHNLKHSLSNFLETYTYLNNKICRIKWMPRCLVNERCGRPIFGMSTGPTWKIK